MGLKIKDLLNKKINSRNHQISLDVKKKKLKELDLDVDDILDIEIVKGERKWQI